jgi:phenylalanyl-tRNA synthetase beta chain
MLFSYNWLKEYIQGEMPSPEKLEELLTMHSFEIEEVKRKGSDYIFDIDVLPNRAHDALSHTGMAREICAITGKKFSFSKKKKKGRVLVNKKGGLAPLEVRILAKQFVPRYHALVVKDVRVEPSPQWMQNRLESLGIKVINNIVDITNYVMLEVGQPLHAFDFDTARGQTMIVRQAKKGEQLVLLDDTAVILPEGALVIQDKERLIDLAGIMGGKVSAISGNTKNIIIQAANFEAVGIFKTKKTLGLNTQAAHIYSHGIDPSLSEAALSRAEELLHSMSRGSTVEREIDIYPRKVAPKTIVLDPLYAERLLGMKVNVKAMLERIGCKVQGRRVTVPTYRLDLHSPEDLVEEVGRITGYEHIRPLFPTMPIQPGPLNGEVIWLNRIRDTLKEAGFTESYNYSFASEGEVELLNPISEEYTHLRVELLNGLLKNIAKNQRIRDRIRLFEIGKVFHKPAKESWVLSGVITGEQSFYEIKGVIDELFHALGIARVSYMDIRGPAKQPWHSKRTASIHNLGIMGEISKSTLSRMKIIQRVGGFTIQADRLLEKAREEKGYRPISKFPAAIRDLSILVPRETRVVEILNVIHRAGGELIDDVDIFDIYEGERIPGDKKNVAFHIVYQSQKRTLTNYEVDRIHTSIIKQLEKNPTWQPRT